MFNSNIAYTLPVGKGKKLLDRGGWVDTLVGGWDLGAIITWQTGAPFSLFSQRSTGPQVAPNPENPTQSSSSWITYSGPATIGGVDRRGNGVFFFTPDEVAALTAASVVAGPGELGTLYANPGGLSAAELESYFREHGASPGAQ